MVSPSPSQTQPTSSSLAVTVAALTSVAAVTASIFALTVYSKHKKTMARIAQNEEWISKLEETRKAERMGRIRAEMKLRTHMKREEAKNTEEDGRCYGNGSKDVNNRAMEPLPEQNGENKNHDKPHLKHNLLMNCIGTVVSPYTKRMGTPRQGALVPSGRGFIQLRIPVECVEGFECYSHAWILFTFHANTDAPNMSGGEKMMKLSKTKIRPPRGNGIKVGMLATRSPHRPNNVGLSLVKIVRVDKKEKRLHIAAFDLVNGTPIYDIKPCVPWDIPGHHDNSPLTVPTWVSQDDALQTVKFTSKACQSLDTHVRNGKLSPLYTLENDGVHAAKKTIGEILAQDPRASNTNGPNKRGSNSQNSTNAETYKLVFCSVEVEFRVSNDVVIVEDVADIDLNDVLHVDGIPVLLHGRK